MKKICYSLVLILLLVFGFAVTVNAETTDAYNIVTCPGENMATEMLINWQSSTSFKEMSVEYTVDTDDTFTHKLVSKGSYVEFHRDDTKYAVFVGMKTPRHVWRASLPNLTPETKYIYRIVSDGKVCSNIYRFETASLENKDFNFLFMTDPQYYNEDGAVRFNKMAERHIADDNVKFAFLTGDITDRGGNSNLWKMFFDKTSLAKIPYVTTVGNHEYYDSRTTTLDNSIFNNFFYNPQNGPEHLKGSAYWCLYNGVLFIMVDSEDNEYLDEQREWFKNVCNTVHARYIIVGAHRSPYAGANYYDQGMQFLERWGYLFDQCSVDLVLSGHDHMYARTKNLYNSEICTEKYKGTTYILGGSAGLKYYPQKVHTNEPLWAKWFEMTTSATVVKVSESSLTIKTVDYDGNIKDQAIISAKRFGNVDKNYTKEEFEKSLTATLNAKDITSGEITWDKRGYGHVTSLEFKNLNSGDIIGGTQFLNDQTNYFKVKKGYLIGEQNEIETTINYNDGSIGKVIIKLDNSINWGEITNFRVSEVTSESVTFTWNQNLNSKYDYLDRVQIYKDGIKAKNSLLKDSDLKKNEYSITVNRGLEPNKTYEFKVDILNVNGHPAYSETISVSTPKELTYEEIYQNNLGSLAIKNAIDNLLKAIGAK